jgi:hypothetical protein
LQKVLGVFNTVAGPVASAAAVYSYAR